MLIQDKKTDDLYGKFNLKTFFDEEDANAYYEKMILEASTFSKEKIEDLVRDLQLALKSIEKHRKALKSIEKHRLVLDLAKSSGKIQ